MLDETSNNYICSICIDGVSAGLSFFDISTGEAYATATEGVSYVQLMLNEIAKFMPREILVNVPCSEIPQLDDFIKMRLRAVVNDKDAFRYDKDKAEKVVRGQFPGEASLLEAGGTALVRRSAPSCCIFRRRRKPTYPTLAPLTYTVRISSWKWTSTRGEIWSFAKPCG